MRTSGEDGEREINHHGKTITVGGNKNSESESDSVSILSFSYFPSNTANGYLSPQEPQLDTKAIN